MNATYICGGRTGTGPKREADCPSPLHDWPEPTGYVDATVEADWRLRNGWSNKRCPDCGRYGWQPGKRTVAHQQRGVPNA